MNNDDETYDFDDQENRGFAFECHDCCRTCGDQEHTTAEHEEKESVNE
jgi:hypothetical protein